MKLTTVTIILLVILAGCHQKNRYTIQGSISGEPTEPYIYLTQYTKYTYLKIDSAKTQHGKFKFKGSIELPEVFCLFYPSEKNYVQKEFILEPGNFRATIDPSAFSADLPIQGGTFNEIYNKVTAPTRIRDGIPIDSLQPEDILKWNSDMAISNEEYDISVFKFINANPGSPVSVLLLSRFFHELPFKKKERIMNGLHTSVSYMMLYKAYRTDYENEIKLMDETPSLIVDNRGVRQIKFEFGDTPIFQALAERNPGKILYIDIWGTWCGPCIANFPYIKKLAQKYDPEKLAFIYLCVKSVEDQWIDVVKKQDLTGQHYLLGEKLQNRLSKEIKSSLESFPTYVLIDPNGKVVSYRAPGPYSPKIYEMIETILKSS